MAVYTIAQYRVTSEAVDKVKKAIEEFVRYVNQRTPDPAVRGVAAERGSDAVRALFHL